MSPRLRVGTRGSALARAQTEWVAGCIRREHPGVDVEIVEVRTKGDRLAGAPLSQLGGQGAFTKELEEALQGGRIDVAVHSLKDLPTVLPRGLILAAVPEREDPRDVAVTRGGACLADLAPGARVGTSSLRRRAQVRRAAPHLQPVDLRGNVDTRLAKVAAGEVDAAIMARPGLARLGLLDRVTEHLGLDAFLPAPGQGALGVEARAGDEGTLDLVACVHDPAAAAAVTAEREVLRRLEGGCLIPLAALALPEGGGLRLRAILYDPGGGAPLEVAGQGPAVHALALGGEVAEALERRGARELVAEWRRQLPARGGTP